MSKFRLHKYYNRLKRTRSIHKLTASQKQEIRDYSLKNFGVKVSAKWHEILYSISGVYRYDYMTFDVYNHLIESCLLSRQEKINKVLYKYD